MQALEAHLQRELLRAARRVGEDLNRDLEADSAFVEFDLDAEILVKFSGWWRRCYHFLNPERLLGGQRDARAGRAPGGCIKE